MIDTQNVVEQPSYEKRNIFQRPGRWIARMLGDRQTGGKQNNIAVLEPDGESNSLLGFNGGRYWSNAILRTIRFPAFYAVREIAIV